jgi:uncharacterized protein
MDKVGGRCQVSLVLDAKYQKLRQLLESYESCIVAYSGGVDSVFLAYVAADVLGTRALAAIADSPSLPRREFREAIDLARRFHIPLRVIKTEEFENAEYLANPTNRCYFCKHELFTQLVPLARAERYAVLAYGENATDASDVRPGAKAAQEFDIRAPLKEVGLTKAEIRTLSAGLGLPTADKPQMACLSSRIPHGESVETRKLGMIEAAENILRDEGFFDVRVRHHALSTGDLARIEVGPQELPRFFADGVAGKMAGALRQVGYLHVTVDLLGYRRGNTSEVAYSPRSVSDA